MRTRNTFYIELNKTNRSIIALALVFLLVLFLVAVVSTSLGPRTLQVFQSNTSTNLLQPRGTWDSVHLDQNLKPLDQDLKGEYFDNDLLIVDLPANPLSNNQEFNIKAEFMLTSGVSEVSAYIDQPNYKAELVFSRLLENINWSKKEDQGLTFWDRTDKVNTLNELTEVAGNEGRNILLVNTDFQPPVTIEGLPDIGSLREIYLPLRRSFEAAFYSSGKELTYIELTKRDLNLYDGADPVEISILNQKGELILTREIPDDGVKLIGRYADTVQRVNFNDFLPAGLYYMRVRQEDSIIENITTNLSKFVFKNNLFAANHPFYTPTAKPLNIYTNADELVITAIHDFAHQTMQNNGVDLKIDQTNFPYEVPLKPLSQHELSTINFQLGSLFIKSNGFFATSPDLFFNPNPFNLYNFDEYNSRLTYDFIIANYKLLKVEGGHFSADFKLPGSGSRTNTSRLMISIKKASPKDGIMFRKFDVTY